MPDQQVHPRLAQIYGRHPRLYPKIGDSSPSGWGDIVADVLEQVLALEHETGYLATLVQIKEKFAGLRMYFGPSRPASEQAARDPSGLSLAGFNQAVQELVDEAEKRARATCQTCGAAGVMRMKRGFYFTACDAHSMGAAPAPQNED